MRDEVLLLFILLMLSSFIMTSGTALLIIALRHWRHLPVVKILALFILSVMLAGGLLFILSFGVAITQTHLPVLRYGVCVACAVIGGVAGYAAWYLETGGGEGKGFGVKAWLGRLWTGIKNMLRRKL